MLLSVKETGWQSEKLKGAAGDSPMRAPASWERNIDLGLLIVMCPVLKSCKEHTAKEWARCSSSHDLPQHSNRYALGAQQLCAVCILMDSMMTHSHACWLR
jgi:hypothetical protein